MSNPQNTIVCTRCVLDSTIHNIKFDEQGVCNFCLDFDKLPPEQILSRGASEKLQQLLRKIKKDGQGKDYDCIIGLSGGVDSSYVAWLVKQWGLRPLAVHLDNGWNSELAVSNIEKICHKLEIDLYTHVINWEEFKDLQVAFLKASVANAEIPTDHAIFAILYQMARKHSVNYILDGVNTSTEFVRKGFDSGGYFYADATQLLDIHRKFGKKRLRTFPVMGLVKKLINQKVFGIRQVSPLNLVRFIKQDATELLMRELDWKPYDGKHHESIFTKWHQLVHLPRKFNFDKRRLHYSDLILSGQISREQALNELATKQLPPQEITELEFYVRKKLGLSEAEYTGIFLTPVKTWRDYANSMWLVNLYKRLS